MDYGDLSPIWTNVPANPRSMSCQLRLVVLVGKDQSTLLVNGLTFGAQKCSVMRGHWQDGQFTMDLRTESPTFDITGGGPIFDITVTMTATMLVQLMGKEGTHGAVISRKRYEMASQY